jgi:hypothetical protein
MKLEFLFHGNISNHHSFFPELLAGTRRKEAMLFV